MNNEQLRELLYDYANGRLEDKEIELIEKALASSTDLQHELMNIRRTLNMLDDYYKPPPSAGFRSRLKISIEERKIKQSKNFIEEIFKTFYTKLPLQIISIAAVLILTFFVYMYYSPTVPYQQIRSTDSILEGTYSEAKFPIIIKSTNIKDSYNKLSEILASVDGKIVRRKLTDKSLFLFIRINNNSETSFLEDLKKLGEIESFTNEYKDSDGNIVIELTE